MTNFIFKSTSTYKKLANNIEVVLNEQRHQRSDLAAIIRMLKKLTTEATLQKQVDDWYEKSPDSETCIAPEDKMDLD